MLMKLTWIPDQIKKGMQHSRRSFDYQCNVVSITQPGEAGNEECRLKIEDLWYRFALSLQLKAIELLK
jgi:hypothetical protein